MSDERAKLDTKIEREVHRLIQRISESTYDKLQVFVRKNNYPVDYDVLTSILNTMKIAITEAEMTNMDSFHNSIKKELDDYTGDENPTVSQLTVGKEKETTSKKSQTTSATTSAANLKKRKPVTISLWNHP